MILLAYFSFTFYHRRYRKKAHYPLARTVSMVGDMINRKLVAQSKEKGEIDKSESDG